MDVSQAHSRLLVSEKSTVLHIKDKKNDKKASVSSSPKIARKCIKLHKS